MVLLILSSGLMKKYIVQIRSRSGSWHKHASFRNLEQAKQAVQQLKRQNSKTEARIWNRFTGQVVKL
jgi:hypothetical protein